MLKKIELKAIISKSQCGYRLDQALVLSFPHYSRSCIKKWILDQGVLVNNKIWNKPKKKVLGGESVTINAKIIENKIPLKAQNIPLDIVYEDNNILVINKPNDMVVHPGNGNSDGTILNALLHYFPSLINLPRAGIVHRLDKHTTGLMVVAKTAIAQIRLIESFKLHKITREYEAVAVGRIISDGTVDRPIKHHPTKYTCMIVHPTGKPAVTHYRIMEHFRIHTRLRLRLETGRTHQIRVHTAYLNHPLVGDKVYGNHKLNLPKSASEEFRSAILKFNRQALHAAMLRFCHPITGTQMEWHQPIPKDMSDLIKAMRIDCKKYNQI